MFRITPVVKNILLINLAIFLIQSFFSIRLSEVFGLRVVFSEEFGFHQFLTYMWIHGDFRHIFGNMLMVLFLAPMLERVWGGKRFLIFYLICGIGAGILYGVADVAEKWSLRDDKAAYIADPNPEDFSIFIVEHKSPRYNLPRLADFADDYYDNSNNVSYRNQSIQIVQDIYQDMVNIPMVGASGAVYGILMALLILFPNMTVYLYFAIPVKLKYLVFGLGMYEIWSEINRAEGDNIAHLAHLGGMLIAFVVIKIWSKNSNRLY